MSEHKDQQNKPDFSVDEILAEFGTGRYEKKPSKVVEFPQQPRQKREKRPPQQEPAPVDEIVPETRARGLAARLSVLFRRADHYADHMYDQAEPDEATLRAEQYVPGVDKEEIPEEPVGKRVLRRPAKLPPDTPAAELVKRYQKGLKGRGRRVGFAFVLSLLAIPASLDLPMPLNLTELPVSLFQLRCWVLSGLLLMVGALCWDILAAGVKKLFTLRIGAETLTTLAWVFTLADGLTAHLWEAREACPPCAAVAALGLTFHLWGFQAHRKGDRAAAKTASQVHNPYIVTLEENKWSGRPAFTKASSESVGFGSRLQMADGGTRAYRIAAPLMLLCALLCAVMASVGQNVPTRFLWCASTIFSATASWSALLAYGLPYRKLCARLSRVGAALTGWTGAVKGKESGIIITDVDLFPPGSVKVAQVKVFGGVATEKVIGFTTTLLRIQDGGLARPFHDLLRTQGAFYREASGIRHHEGGISGIIRNQEVLVGTAAFMHMADIPMPQGLNVKNALFCALDGQLAGMFLLHYAMSGEVNPSLSALMNADVAPILATRDFNLIPALLEQKFRLPVDRMEFPPVERRTELSQPSDGEGTPVAVLSREGLSAYSDAVVGGRRLRKATKLSLIFAILGGVAGLILTFYLTAVGAYTSLTPAVFLVFMALWLVPELFIANWVNQY